MARPPKILSPAEKAAANAREQLERAAAHIKSFIKKPYEERIVESFRIRNETVQNSKGVHSDAVKKAFELLAKDETFGIIETKEEAQQYAEETLRAEGVDPHTRLFTMKIVEGVLRHSEGAAMAAWDPAHRVLGL
ncbi:MAG: hypothetical protein ACRBCT_01945 [Alphaproteobacteria bacterium]